jgi:hypothetical protein
MDAKPDGPEPLRFQYGLRDLFTLMLQAALFLSVIATVIRTGVVRYNVAMLGIGPPGGWLLYGLPFDFYDLHAFSVVIGLVALVAFLVKRRVKLPRFWVGWLALIAMTAFFVVARVFRPLVEY